MAFLAVHQYSILESPKDSDTHNEVAINSNDKIEPWFNRQVLVGVAEDLEAIRTVAGRLGWRLGSRIRVQTRNKLVEYVEHDFMFPKAGGGSRDEGGVVCHMRPQKGREGEVKFDALVSRLHCMMRSFRVSRHVAPSAWANPLNATNYMNRVGREGSRKTLKTTRRSSPCHATSGGFSASPPPVFGLQMFLRIRRVLQTQRSMAAITAPTGGPAMFPPPYRDARGRPIQHQSYESGQGPAHTSSRFTDLGL